MCMFDFIEHLQMYNRDCRKQKTKKKEKEMVIMGKALQSVCNTLFFFEVAEPSRNET